MRILHVTDSYLPCLGGIEMHVHDLAARQQRAGHDVRILTVTAAGDDSVDGPVPVSRLPWNPLAPGTSAFIERFVEDEKVDVVHIHLSVGSPLGWAALRAIPDAGRLATMHSVVPDAPRLVRATLRLTRVRTEGVVFTAVSDVAARPLRAALPDSEVHVLPNGINAAFWTVAAVEPDDVFTIVTVGRLTRRKRVRALIEIVDRVRRTLPPGRALRVLIVGDGPQIGLLRRDIARRGLGDVVELLGARSREEILTILGCADAFLAPARLESFGIAALEARCAGLPVVAMACSGVGEFITDGVEGFLVEDDAAMAAAAVDLAMVPGLRKRIADHNASTEPTMSWERVLDRHDDLYERAIGSAAVPGEAYDQVSSVRRD